MSTSPDESRQPEGNLDLDLHFLPAWAQAAPDLNRYANFKGEDEGRDRSASRGRGDRRSSGPRRDGPGAPRSGGGGDRRAGSTSGPSRDSRNRPGNGGQRRDFGRGRGAPHREENREPAPPPLDLDISFVPEEKGVESLAKQIKLSGRAYPLFDIAHLVLKKPERYHVQLAGKKKADGQTQQLFVCGLDETIWLSEQEAVDHVLNKHFGTFYQAEKIPTDPPKGTYTFVAQCGISGTILGPPNFHDYQNKVHKLHQERFSRMPFETFKSRIKIVKDEAIVTKWKEEQSFRTEYTCLNIPETIKLGTRDEVEKHFRATHLPNVVKSVDTVTIPGAATQTAGSRALQQFIRRSWDDQMRFPLKVVNVLSGQFARHGLQFFKVNKSVTHVAVARPRYLDLEASPVSENLKKLVQFIDSHPKCTRRSLLEHFVPDAARYFNQPKPTDETPQTAMPPTPEMEAVIADLHWLIHQGHVIEFANGHMETAKKPAPRPQKPEKPQAAPATEATPETTASKSTQNVQGEGSPNPEIAVETTTEDTAHSAINESSNEAEIPSNDDPKESLN
ncbi:MAG: hypothetical protein SFY81_06125 [Verrucomicrobiota bacterium]|nr:hypothetical protein [Verrucomicrobiota bacterium]